MSDNEKKINPIPQPTPMGGYGKPSASEAWWLFNFIGSFIGWMFFFAMLFRWASSHCS